MAKGQIKQKQATIDKRKFEYLCYLLFNKRQISNVFGVHFNTLNNWCYSTYGKTFKQVYKEIMVRRLVELRKSQFELAKTSAKMGIWLGKVYLSQSDKPKVILKPPIIIESKGN